MRRRKTRRCRHMGLAVLLAVVSGCATTWRTPPGLTAASTIAEQSPDRVRVTTQDGIRTELLFPWIEGDSLYATPDTARAVPNSYRADLADVALVEVSSRTAGPALHVVTLLLMVPVIVAILFVTADLCPGLAC